MVKARTLKWPLLGFRVELAIEVLVLVHFGLSVYFIGGWLVVVLSVVEGRGEEGRGEERRGVGG